MGKSGKQSRGTLRQCRVRTQLMCCAFILELGVLRGGCDGAEHVTEGNRSNSHDGMWWIVTEYLMEWRWRKQILVESSDYTMQHIYPLLWLVILLRFIAPFPSFAPLQILYCFLSSIVFLACLSVYVVESLGLFTLWSPVTLQSMLHSPQVFGVLLCTAPWLSRQVSAYRHGFVVVVTNIIAILQLVA